MTSSRLPYLVLLLISCAALRASFRPPVQCSGGAEIIDGACYCANGTTWNGQTCQGTPDPTGCSGGGFMFGPPNARSCHCLLGYTIDNGQCTQLQCSGGAVPGDTECVCPDNTQWDGAQCVVPVAPEPAPEPPVEPAPEPTPQPEPAPVPRPVARRTCLSVMAEKGYVPAQWPSCKGVNERCAIALLDHGFVPAQLASCRGVDGACAEQLFNQGYVPAQLSNCKRR